MSSTKGTDSQNFDLYSEEVQEIISYIPPSVVRWGIGSFLMFLILLLLVSWLIHYPDIVYSPFRLTAKNSPKVLLAPLDTKLTRILVQEKDIVHTGQSLAFLEATANHKDVLSLAFQLDTLVQFLEMNGANHLQYLPALRVTNLGELQASYQAFTQAYENYLSYGKSGYNTHKRDILEKELLNLIGLEKALNDQLLIQTKDYQISFEEYQVQKQLADQKVIAALELKRETSRLLAKELPLKQTQALLFENRASITSKQKELMAIDDAIEKKQFQFLQAINILRSEIANWEKKYIITSPLNGIVNYSSFLEENQSVSLHQELFYINPVSKEYYGELSIPQKNLGKVIKGQKVLIKFDSYPFQEYGFVEGKVDYLSDMPARDNSFLAKVTLPKGLFTNYNKQISYKTGMNATAEIITDDTRLIEKFIFNFKKLVSR